MREIKCRAWDKDFGRWVSVFPCIIPTEADGKTFRLETTENLKLVWFTGLKDRNGKEIYEGDIVAYSLKSLPMLVKFGAWDNDEEYEGHEFGNGWYVEYITVHRKKLKTHQTYLDDRPMMVDKETLHKIIIGNIYEGVDQ